jgi:hypothetical protein
MSDGDSDAETVVSLAQASATESAARGGASSTESAARGGVQRAEGDTGSAAPPAAGGCAPVDSRLTAGSGAPGSAQPSLGSAEPAGAQPATVSDTGSAAPPAAGGGTPADARPAAGGGAPSGAQPATGSAEPAALARGAAHSGAHPTIIAGDSSGGSRHQEPAALGAAGASPSSTSASASAQPSTGIVGPRAALTPHVTSALSGTSYAGSAGGGGVYSAAPPATASGAATPPGAALAHLLASNLAAPTAAVAARLWEAALPPHSPFIKLLTAADAPPPLALRAEAGAVVVADLHLGTATRYSAAAASYSPEPRIVALARAARASESFGIIFSHRGALGAGAVANAPSAVLRVCADVYGDAAAALWDELASAPSDSVLPVVRRALEAARRSVRAEAEAAAAAGEAAPRTESSIANRAKAVLLVDELRRVLAGGTGQAFTQCWMRRAIRSATAEVSGNSPKPPPAHWADLEAMVAASGWPRLTRSTCGWPFDLSQRGVLPHHAPAVDPNELVAIFIETFGEPPDDSPLWTLAAHAFMHESAVEPWLDDAVARARAATGGPLRLYDTAKVDVYTPDQLELFKQEVYHLHSIGVLEGPMTPAQLADGESVKVVMRMSCVFKGVLSVSDEEAAAVSDNDIPALARLATERAARIGAKARQLLAAATARGESAPGGSIVSSVMAAELANVIKTRPVIGGHVLGRVGCDKAGLPPYGIRKFSCVGPSSSELLEGVKKGYLTGKSDVRNFFYCLVLGFRSRPYFCVATPDFGHGELIWRFTRPTMGGPDSGGAAQSITSIVSLVANARLLGVTVGRGVAAISDDIVSVVKTADAGRVVHDVVLGLLQRVNLPEAVKKREVHSGDVVVLGKRWNLADGVISLPAERGHRYLIASALALDLLADERQSVRDLITTSYLESVTGELSWWSEATPAGAAHLGSLYAITKHKHSLRDHARRGAVVKTLRWWMDSAAAGALNGTVLLDGDDGAGIHDASIDASDIAIAAVDDDNKRIAWRLLTDDERVTAGQPSSSAFRECLAAELVFTALAPAWPPHGSANAIAVIKTDASACLGALLNSRAEGRGGEVVTRIVAAAALARITYLGLWQCREHNQAADAASKCATLKEVQALAARLGYTLVA